MATVKRQRSRMLKSFRREGMSFMLAATCARFVVANKFASELEDKLDEHGVRWKVVTTCECCGPEYLDVFENGRVFRFRLHYVSFVESFDERV